MGTKTADLASGGADTRQARIRKRSFRRCAVGLFILLSAVWYVGLRPGTPSEVVVAEVVALRDLPDGWREITVRLADGHTEDIRTLAPFFFRPGYKARVGIFKRPLMVDQYDIVGDGVTDKRS